MAASPRPLSSARRRGGAAITSAKEPNVAISSFASGFTSRCAQTNRRFAMRRSSAAVVMVVSSVVASLAARADEPVLRIAKQGSMEAGGRMINCATNDGGDPKSTRWPAGHVVVDNVYATYQYPADQRYPHPILFNSGGGHTARVYDTTPDGREGGLTLVLR